MKSTVLSIITKNPITPARGIQAECQTIVAVWCAEKALKPADLLGAKKESEHFDSFKELRGHLVETFPTLSKSPSLAGNYVNLALERVINEMPTAEAVKAEKEAKEAEEKAAKAKAKEEAKAASAPTEEEDAASVEELDEEVVAE